MFWTVLFYGLIYLILLIKHKIYRIISKGIIIILCALSLFVIYFEMTVFDWSLQWNHDDFKMNYYQQDIDCKRAFRFFD